MLVAQIHVFRKTRVERWLSVERNGNVLGVLSVQPLFSRHLWVATKSREQTALSAHRFIQQIEWVLVGQFKRIHVRFSPAVGASEVALVNNRRHLHAVVALNTVEFTLVALAVSQQRFLRPVACFHTTVLAHNVVALLLQFGFQLRVHACHRDHSRVLIPRLSRARQGMARMYSGSAMRLSMPRWRYRGGGLPVFSVN